MVSLTADMAGEWGDGGVEGWGDGGEAPSSKLQPSSAWGPREGRSSELLRRLEVGGWCDSRSHTWAVAQLIVGYHRLLDQPVRNFVAEFHLSDFTRQHELDFSSGHFFVEPHNSEEPLPIRDGQFRFRRQAGAMEKVGDAFDVALRQVNELSRKAGSRDLADGNRFAVEMLAIGRDGLQRVADGVAEI